MGKIFGKFNKNYFVVARTPLDTSSHLFKNKGEDISQLEYSQGIGSLIYLTSCIRPDLNYRVSKLARYTSDLRVDHCKAMVRVLRYLGYTRNCGL